MKCRFDNVMMVVGGVVVLMGFAYPYLYLIGFAHSSNFTKDNITLSCIRGFYSDEMNKDYESDLTKFCNG